MTGKADFTDEEWERMADENLDPMNQEGRS